MARFSLALRRRVTKPLLECMLEQMPERLPMLALSRAVKMMRERALELEGVYGQHWMNEDGTRRVKEEHDQLLIDAIVLEELRQELKR